MIQRLLALRAPEALAVAGVALTAAGLAVLADALAAAAPSREFSTGDRIALGLWQLRLEHALTLTAGLALLTVAVRLQAQPDWLMRPAARLGVGIACGVIVLAAAVVISATDVALRGHVGSGFVEAHPSDRARVFVWLRQVVTAAGFATVWAVTAAYLDRAGRPRVTEEVPAPEPIAPAPAPPIQDPPSAPAAVVRPAAAVPAPATVPPFRAAPVVHRDGPGARARRVVEERLAYSPRAAEARKLAELVERLEREGQSAEAEQALERLERL